MAVHRAPCAVTEPTSERFLAFVARPLPTVTPGDVQAFAYSLSGKPSSRARTLAAVKSLLAFGQSTVYLSMYVGAAVKLPQSKNTLVERILTESDVVRIVALEPNRRNQVLLRLLIERARVLEAAYAAHPERCVRQLPLPPPPARASLDQSPNGGDASTVIPQPTGLTIVDSFQRAARSACPGPRLARQALCRGAADTFRAVAAP